MDSTRSYASIEAPAVVAAPAALRVPRPRAVCPVCQYHKPVRVSGVMAKHRSYWAPTCPGVGATPIPVPVREPDPGPAGYHDGRTLDRWDFLSLPLLVLLHITRTKVREVAEPGFTGSIRPVTASSPFRWIAYMPVGGDILDHDLAVRGLLAMVHGTDVTDWPVLMVLRAE